MKPSTRIEQLQDEIHNHGTGGMCQYCLNDPIKSGLKVNALIRYLDEEWGKTHCDTPVSYEPGNVHDCSKIHD